MKVIKNMYNNKNVEQQKQKTYNVICEMCDSELELEDSDIEVGQYGMGKFVCPCCGEEVYPEELSCYFELTKDNIKYPIHYSSFENGVNIEDEKIDKYVRKVLNSFDENNEDDWVRFYMSGNTAIFIFKFDGDNKYQIYVCKNYKESFVPIN